MAFDGSQEVASRAIAKTVESRTEVLAAGSESADGAAGAAFSVDQGAAAVRASMAFHVGLR